MSDELLLGSGFPGFVVIGETPNGVVRYYLDASGNWLTSLQKDRARVFESKGAAYEAARKLDDRLIVRVMPV